MNEGDLIKLGERLRSISEAPAADRMQLYKQLAIETWTSSPDLARYATTKYLNGAFHAHKYYEVFEIAINRADISEDDKLWAQESAFEFYEDLQEAVKSPSGLVSLGLALDLAMNALFAGLRAGMTPEQVTKFREDWFSALQRERGKKSAEKRKADRPWVTHAKERAHHFRTKHKTWSRSRIANAILSEWKSTSQIANPSYDQLLDHVKELELSGELPPRTGKSQA